jgi:transcriptional regulator with XRE-family HTH domain
VSKVVDKVVDNGVVVDNLKREGIGARFKAVRKHLGGSQKSFAEALGVSWRGIQENENHDRVPGGKILSGLTARGINTHWLLTEEGEMLLNQGAQSAPGELPASHAQYLVEESAPQPEGPAGVDAAFLRLCLGACVMVHGDPFARESTALQLEYACDLYNLLMKQAAAHGQGLKAGLADFSRLETRGLADQLRLLLQMNWARAYIYGDSTRPQGPSPSPGSY